MADYTSDLANARKLDGDIVAAGQPTAAQLDAARREGVHTVVNLRPAGEFDAFDEAAHVRDAGMTYVHIPVAGPDDINDASARRLDEALGAEGGVPALVHCASSNRVGALLAYRARHIQGRSADEAMEIGRAAGLNPKSPLLEATRAKLG
ncbi:hypothetical protein SAOR_02320 [Salinisphaera orenii MK-B5]|uniref:Beta-lactamase hydrolase-like protein phosphatase-like domain-containing protein n=2 Tax=Salinisphaera orenii TaxID=856731 RepID=A0A423PWK0_9GAMM|nr:MULTISPECIES: protein tyrosine phosphatase family protein [Salinisphaera]ROO24782.1 hypothetical protein SAHL_15555 [Salinisphaera halophila YIM 95161]ROO29931.1 hypothetical protein SAOR_02320 [Salinisphaera orenii MK-B5]